MVKNWHSLVAGALILLGSSPAYSQEQYFGDIKNTIIKGDSSIGPTSVRAADLDNDGDNDLVIASDGSNSLFWSENTGSGAFTYHLISDQITRARSAQILDFNNDGYLDVAVASENGNSVSVFYQTAQNETTPSFYLHHTWEGILGAFEITVADISQDGFEDLIVTARNDSSIHILFNNSNAPTQTFVPEFRTFRPVKTLAFDIDHDGDVDIVSGNGNGGFNSAIDELVLLKNEGNNVFTEHLLVENIPNTWDLSLADFNGDGFQEILYNTRSFSTNIICWTGADHITDSTTVITAGGSTGSLVNDVDGDGDMDIVIGSGNVFNLSYHENDGFGNFTKKDQTNFTSGLMSDISLGDMDGDGDKDYLVALSHDKEVAWVENTLIICQLEEVDVFAPEEVQIGTTAEIIIPLPQEGVSYSIFDENFGTLESYVDTAHEGEIVFETFEIEAGQNTFQVLAETANCELSFEEVTVINGVDLSVAIQAEEVYFSSQENTVLLPITIGAYKNISGINGKFSYDTLAFSNVELAGENPEEGPQCFINTNAEAGTVNLIWQGSDFENGHTTTEETVLFNLIFHVNQGNAGVFNIDLINFSNQWTISHVHGFEIPSILFNGFIELAEPILFETQIQTPNGEIVPDINFSYSGRGGADSVSITTGYYSRLVLPGLFNFNLSKTDNEDPTNGINVVDITLLRRHILQLEELNNLERLAAADVNGDGAENLDDVLGIKLVILEVLNSFNGEAWRFVPVSYEFNSDTLPSSWEAEINQTNPWFDFHAVKIGDINFDWLSPLNSVHEAPIAFNLVFGEKDANGNTPVYLPSDMIATGIQFTLETTEGDITILPGAINPQQGKKENGIATAIWEDESATGLSLSAAEPLFFVQSAGTITVNDKYTKSILADENLQVSRFGGEKAVGIHELNPALDNCVNLYPVPANNHVTIASCDGVSIDNYKVFSNDGRLVLSGTANGASAIELTASDLPANGIYQVLIQTNNGISHKNLIIKK